MDLLKNEKNKKLFNKLSVIFCKYYDYISPCWITTVLSSIIFFMMVMLMITSISSDSLRIPRCTHRNEEKLDNTTIHLVHDASKWSQKQLDILEAIKNKYRRFNVELVLLKSPSENPNGVCKISTPSPESHEGNSGKSPLLHETTSHINSAVIEIKRAKRSKRKTRSLKRKKRDRSENNGFALGMGVKSLLDILLNSRVGNNINIQRNINGTQSLMESNSTLPTLTTEKPRPKTLEDIIENFPNLKIKNMTFEEAFSNTPLKKAWLNLNHDLTIFAVRILHLWQHGGLSFEINAGPVKSWEDLENFSVAPEVTLRNLDSNQLLPIASPFTNKLLNFVTSGKEIYEKLPLEVVTADDEGLHIFTKTPCHAFMGDILMNLKYAKDYDTVKGIIRKSLEVFCKHSAVGRKYCENLIRRRG